MALRDHFQGGAAATAAIFSVAGLVAAFSSPFLGRFLDRAGPRIMFPLAGLLLLIGWITSGLVTDLWQLFLVYSVIEAIGQTSISSFSNTAVLAPWFPETTRRALGLADSGNPTGQFDIYSISLSSSRQHRMESIVPDFWDNLFSTSNSN